ncbi:MAG: hypothetical protein M3R38_14315, partial [Actinomycetota bacterium]|nr:hypothetical protein [Actinomycetota bacterium]
RRENNRASHERKAQSQRESHERRLQEEQRQHDRRQWLLAERRRVYAHLASLSATVDKSKPYELKDLAEACSEIELLSDSGAVVASARDLYGAQFRARKKAREMAEAGLIPEEEEEYIKLHRDKDMHRENFIENARHDLGLDMRPGQTGA